MEYRPLGRTGVQVSQFCLGTMMFGGKADREESLRILDHALDDLVRAGKIRYVGGSMFPSWRMVESLWVAKELGLNRLVCEQPAYHMLDRTAEREVIPAARSFGLAVIPWGPLCGGLLTGKYRRDAGDPDGRWQSGKDNFGREATPLAWDVLDLLRTLADEKGCTVSQLALKVGSGLLVDKLLGGDRPTEPAPTPEDADAPAVRRIRSTPASVDL